MSPTRSPSEQGTPAGGVLPELENPYHRLARPWGIGFGVCLVVGLGGGVSHLLPLGACILVGAVGGTLCLGFWLALWLTAHTVEGELEVFRQGKGLDRWVLSPAETRRWWEDLRKSVTFAARGVGAMFSLTGAVFGLLVWSEENQPMVGAAIFGGSILFGGVVAVVMRHVLAGRRPTEEGVYSVWIGTDPALLAGHVRRWQGPGLRLVSAEALEHPPRLRVVFEAAMKSSWVKQTVEYPAPDLARAASVAAQIEAGRRSGPV